MHVLGMGQKILDDLYKAKTLTPIDIESQVLIGQITDREKFKAAKQILFGLAMLYVFTISAYLVNPTAGEKFLDIITISFPPLTTLILAAYFRDKTN